MDWRATPVVSKGVWERPFYVARGEEQLPGILWMPEEPAGAVPLVLMGHGGKSEKRNPVGLAMARRFVRHHGIAVCAIDAIDHGERGPIRDTGDGPPQQEYVELWKRPDTFDHMNADWSATLDALLTSDRLDPTRIGYWGLSMGTVLGLPFVASEPRISAAVLGACGFTGPSAVRGRFAERHRTDAPSVTCPVLFMVQWDDEIFDREGALELFDAIGSQDKRMHAHPGKHGDFPEEAADATREFLAARLCAPS
ncbi:MAG: dienelactone hydrolase family protein [Chloroflexota bacterium]|nr:dienelactone hydrolase family protein [Chloroflexota bacterium]